MTTFTGQVSASADDADEQGTNNSSPGTVNISTSTSRLDGNTSAARSYLGDRFENVTIAQGSTVSAATLQLYCNSSVDKTMAATAYCEGADNSAQFTTANFNISSRTASTHTVTWSATFTNAAFNTSPSLVNPVQDVISRAGFSSGNALTFIVDDNVTQTSNALVENYDGVNADAAKVSITYTAGSPPSVPTLTNPLSYVSGTSLTANWSAPAGSPTNYDIEISTDNATWTVYSSIGNVTTYTFTGLTANTGYYVRLQADNASGSSGYSISAMGYTSPRTTTTYTLVPVADANGAGTNWSLVGAFSTFWQTLTSGNNSNYAQSPASSGKSFAVTLSNPPSNVLMVIAATYNFTAETSNGSDTSTGVVIATTSASANLWFGVQGTTSLTTSFAAYTNATGYATGVQTLAAWTAAILGFNTFDANGYLRYSAASVTITCLVGIPGTPTGLSATYASATSVTLNLTQGSGYVTDNPAEYSTDNATWSTFDPGSATTSITITGLTAGTLYYFRVAASNGAGTSSYTSSVVWVCGSNYTGQVSQSSDDAFQNTLGTVTIADSTDTLVALDYLAFRFQNVIVPVGADVSAAYIRIYLTSVTGISGSVTVDCESVANSTTFAATSNNISNRTLTGQSVPWSIAGLSTGFNQSPSFADAFDAVNDLGSWASGNAVNVIVTGLVGAAGFTSQMQDGSQTNAAVLVVYFSTASTDESGTFTGEMGSMAVSAAFIALDSQQTSFIAYAVRIADRLWRALNWIAGEIEWLCRSLSGSSIRTITATTTPRESATSPSSSPKVRPSANSSSIGRALMSSVWGRFTRARSAGR